MDNFSPTVITSRKAKKKIEEIKFRHADLLRELDKHKVKVETYRQQKESDRQANESVKREHDRIMSDQQSKSRMEQMAHEKDRMLHEQKMKELEIKKQALSNG